MTRPQIIYKQLVNQKVVPVVRTTSTEIADVMVTNFIKAGFRAIEITLTTPDAFKLIEKFSQFEELTVGAGTVLEVETAEKCIELGADFIVSPCKNDETASVCQNKALAILGGLTPTEIESSFQGGSDVVKVFPADAMGGPKYIQSIKTVFPDIPIVPTGGVTFDNMNDYLKAGSSFVGIGNELANEDLLINQGNEAFIEHSKKYINQSTMILEGN